MKNILLPTDFSTNSLNAMTYAMQLFKDQECTFYVLNVQKHSEFILDDLMAAPTTTTLHSAIAQDNKKELHQLVTQLKEDNNNQNFTFKKLFDFDSLTAAIKQVVASEIIDLIIMGSNGATGAKEVIFGSNTLKVIRSVQCPILVIPENYNFKPIDSILFSIEDCKGLKKNQIKPLIQIKEMHQSSLSVLELNPNNEMDKANLKTCLKDLFEDTPFNYHSIGSVPIPMAINSTIQLLNFDMHTLSIEPKSFLNRFVFGTKDYEICYGTMVPLLVLRP